jgi:hypothetical protein
VDGDVARVNYCFDECNFNSDSKNISDFRKDPARFGFRISEFGGKFFFEDDDKTNALVNGFG